MRQPFLLAQIKAIIYMGDIMLNRFEQFAFAVSAINTYVQKLERAEMEKYGLSGATAQYLIVMNRFEDGITSIELGKICVKDKAAVSRAVKELEKGELIYKKSEHENSYRAKLILTEKGKEAARQVCHAASRAVNEAGKDLTEDERKIFYDSLNKISANLQEMAKEGKRELWPQ